MFSHSQLPMINQKNMKNKFLDSTIVQVFRFKGNLLQKLRNRLIVVASLTATFVVLHEYGVADLTVSFSLPGLMGAALGILLVFRNNTAYERWWEARKALGALVNVSRGFTMKTYHLLKYDTEKQMTLIRLIAAFPFALKGHLREGINLKEVAFLPKRHLEKLKHWKHKPNALADEMIACIQAQYEASKITDYQMNKLTKDVDSLVDILGKCERIKNTPMPLAHNYLLKVYIFAYTFIMPLGFISILSWWTILAVCVIYFLAMSIVIIAEEIEEPFGTDPNDLPFDAITVNIYNNIKEITSNEESLSSDNL